MNLEEMQKVWQEMTEKLDEQKHLTNRIIMDMTKEKFKNKIGRIARYESLGAIACLILVLFIITSLRKLDTWYLMTSGLFIVGYLIGMPLLVLNSIKRMKTINLSTSNYKNTLTQFTKRRKRFLLLQRIGIVGNFFLMILVLPVVSKLFSGKDLFVNQSSEWLWFMAFMILFLIPFSVWGYRKYERMTNSAENLLQDLRS